MEAERSMVVTRGWGERGNNREFFNGFRVSAGDDEKVLEMDGGDGCTIM